jgi:hypothetical protein
MCQTRAHEDRTGCFETHPVRRDFESLTESLRKCSLSLWMGLEKDPQVSLCGPCILLIDTNLTNLPVAAIVLGSEPKKIRDDYK